jgi:hypothetical protein
VRHHRQSRNETTFWKLAFTALALAGMLAACRDATGPEAELTQRLESEHYVYRFSPGDAVDTLWQETYHGWLLPELGIESTPKVEFYKYRDRAQIERLTGEDTNGFAEVGDVPVPYDLADRQSRGRTRHRQCRVRTAAGPDQRGLRGRASDGAVAGSL